MFQGTHTALITPFRNGEVDTEAFRALIERQVEGGVDGIVPCGTTGESPTLGRREHLRVIELAVEYAAGRVKVIAGTGANATSEAIHLTTEAARMGIDATLQVCPYYNKPSQEGLFQHYKAIGEATGLPLMLYSIPGRSVIEISVETQLRLHEACPNICAMKEAGGDPQRVSEIRAALPETYEVLSGDDALTLPFMERGAVGVVSVASNLIPSQLVGMVKAMLSGDKEGAEAIDAECGTLFEGLLKLDTNPVPIKEALALTGAITNQLRLPMVPLDDAKRTQLRELLTKLELL